MLNTTKPSTENIKIRSSVRPTSSSTHRGSNLNSTSHHPNSTKNRVEKRLGRPQSVIFSNRRQSQETSNFLTHNAKIFAQEPPKIDPKVVRPSPKKISKKPNAEIIAELDKFLVRNTVQSAVTSPHNAQFDMVRNQF